MKIENLPLDKRKIKRYNKKGYYILFTGRRKKKVNLYVIITARTSYNACTGFILPRYAIFSAYPCTDMPEIFVACMAFSHVSGIVYMFEVFV